MVDLGTLGGNFSEALAINDRGQVVGRSTTASGVWKAFLWTAKGGMVDLGTLGGNSGQAHAVNSRGQIIGDSKNALNAIHATLWSAPSLTPEEQVKELIAEVERLIRDRGLKREFGRALIFELQIVLQKIHRERTKMACHLLQAFTQQVKILVKFHRLSSSNGQALLDKAQEVSTCQSGT
jgi:probable HAF family extracellular repeat protein